MEKKPILLKKTYNAESSRLQMKQPVVSSKTIVLQSHRKPLPYPWLKQCLQSVESWSKKNHYDYFFMGDELFDPIEESILIKTRQQTVIATDLARLLAQQKYLQQGYQTVIWCDADFLIFDPDRFIIPQTSYALGREVWVQRDKHNKLKAYSKVHNAFLMFRQGNSFLDFYTDTARRLVAMNTGSMPPQFIGPKLLTALHNIVQCPVLETAGMLCPLVIQDLMNGGGAAVDLFNQTSSESIRAANLCSSLVSEQQNRKMNTLIEKLTSQDPALF